MNDFPGDDIDPAAWDAMERIIVDAGFGDVEVRVLRLAIRSYLDAIPKIRVLDRFAHIDTIGKAPVVTFKTAFATEEEARAFVGWLYKHVEVTDE